MSYELQAQLPFQDGVIGYYINDERKLSMCKVLIGEYQCQADRNHVIREGDEVLPIQSSRKWPPGNFVCPKDRGLLRSKPRSSK